MGGDTKKGKIFPTSLGYRSGTIGTRSSMGRTRHAKIRRGSAGFGENKPIKGWPYKVNKAGMIRRIINKDLLAGKLRPFKKSYRGLSDPKGGSNRNRKRVKLYRKEGRGSIRTQRNVARLVAQAFRKVGPHDEVHHKVGDTNDHLSNLRVLSGQAHDEFHASQKRKGHRHAHKSK